MKVVVIGGSASGLYSAIFIKRVHPDFDVCLYEKNDAFGKKLAATGNGHCNLLNKNIDSRAFHNNPLADELFLKFPYPKLLEALKGLGVSLTYIDDLVYPACFHAPTFVSFLVNTAKSLGVRLFPSYRFLSYQNDGDRYLISFDKEKVNADILVFALGGKSQAKLGSDGNYIDELSFHGYKINPFLPSLCPIKTKEKVKKLSGIRHKAKITAYASNEPIYEEEGEILFKNDGLSGIAIMNASSFFLREKGEKTIVVDFFPCLKEEELFSELEYGYRNNKANFLDALLVKNLKEYVLYFIKAKEESLSLLGLKELAHALKGLTFHYESNYGFEQSQVSFGGVDIDEVRHSLESKREKNVYFVGEMLDVDGICGGYNLSFALASSLEVAFSL